MNIALIGNTGSGKTTLATALVERLRLPLVSSGEVARELSKTDASTDLALRQGAQAPEQAMRAAIQARLEQADAQHGGWILDGFPRTVEQLICLMQWTACLPVFVFLEANEWTCVERLVSRGREHDNPDAIGRRLEHFNTHTAKLVRLLDNGDILHRYRLEIAGLEHVVDSIDTLLSQ